MSTFVETVDGLYRTVITYQVGSRTDLQNKVTFEHKHSFNVLAVDLRDFQDVMVYQLAELLDNDCMIKRAVTSSYVADSQPYDPYALVTQDYNKQGEISTVAEVAPWEFVAHIARIPETGRVGRLMLRGAFTDADTEETVDGVKISTSQLLAYQSKVTTFFTAINSAISAMDVPGLLVMAGESLIQHNWSIGPDGKPVDNPTYGPTITRPVTQLVLKGLTIKQKRQ